MSRWDGLAARLVEGVGVRPGELVRIQDNSGRLDIVAATSLAVELAGGTPFVQLSPPWYLGRLLEGASREHLRDWDRHRATLTAQVHRMIHFAGDVVDFDAFPRPAFELWERAAARLSQVESGRPLLVACVPTPARAAQQGLTTDELETVLLPALEVPAAVLRAEIDRVLRAVDGTRTLTLRTGHHELTMERGDRPWLADDGVIDDADVARGAIVSNLPAGSLYTTVLEDSVEGELSVPRMGSARGVLLRMSGGRVVDIEADTGADDVRALFDRHSGEPRRISHLGIGLNPALTRSVGSVLVDEHLHGMGFVAFGDNTYLGGQNGSSLNVDYLLPQVTVLVDGREVVRDGRLLA